MSGFVRLVIGPGYRPWLSAEDKPVPARIRAAVEYAAIAQDHRRSRRITPVRRDADLMAKRCQLLSRASRDSALKHQLPGVKLVIRERTVEVLRLEPGASTASWGGIPNSTILRRPAASPDPGYPLRGRHRHHRFTVFHHQRGTQSDSRPLAWRELIRMAILQHKD